MGFISSCLGYTELFYIPEVTAVFPSNRDVRGTQHFLSQGNGPREVLTEKKARIPCSGLNTGLSFISQDEGMSECPVETIEKAVGVRLIWTGGPHIPLTLKRHTEFNAS